MKLPIILGLLLLPLASFAAPSHTGARRGSDESKAPEKETRVVTLDITGMT